MARAVFVPAGVYELDQKLQHDVVSGYDPMPSVIGAGRDATRFLSSVADDFCFSFVPTAVIDGWSVSLTLSDFSVEAVGGGVSGAGFRVARSLRFRAFRIRGMGFLSPTKYTLGCGLYLGPNEHSLSEPEMEAMIHDCDFPFNLHGMRLYNLNGSASVSNINASGCCMPIVFDQCLVSLSNIETQHDVRATASGLSRGLIGACVENVPDTFVSPLLSGAAATVGVSSSGRCAVAGLEGILESHEGHWLRLQYAGLDALVRVESVVSDSAVVVELGTDHVGQSAVAWELYQAEGSNQIDITGNCYAETSTEVPAFLRFCGAAMQFSSYRVGHSVRMFALQHAVVGTGNGLDSLYYDCTGTQGLAKEQLYLRRLAHVVSVTGDMDCDQYTRPNVQCLAAHRSAASPLHLQARRSSAKSLSSYVRDLGGYILDPMREDLVSGSPITAVIDAGQGAVFSAVGPGSIAVVDGGAMFSGQRVFAFPATGTQGIDTYLGATLFTARPKSGYSLVLVYRLLTTAGSGARYFGVGDGAHPIIAGNHRCVVVDWPESGHPAAWASKSIGTGVNASEAHEVKDVLPHCAVLADLSPYWTVHLNDFRRGQLNGPNGTETKTAVCELRQSGQADAWQVAYAAFIPNSLSIGEAQDLRDLAQSRFPVLLG